MKTVPGGPRHQTRQAAKQCTKEPWPPLFDTVAAGVGVANMVIASNAAPGDVRWYGVEMEHEAGFVLGVTQLVLYGAGAAYGYVQLGRCINLRAKFEDDPNFEPEHWERRQRERRGEVPVGQPRFGASPGGEAEKESEEEATDSFWGEKPASTDPELFEYD